jgi:hypothetical protein
MAPVITEYASWILLAWILANQAGVHRRHHRLLVHRHQRVDYALPFGSHPRSPSR